MIVLSPTDTSWFNFLRNQPKTELVNFWTPTDWNIRELKSKEDFWYFVLKGRQPRKIGGGGRFIGYELMPISRAWRKFGVGNGTASPADMLLKIKNYIAKNTKREASEDPEIGCVILDNCLFLADNQQQTVDELNVSFPGAIVKYKKFDLKILPLNREPQLEIELEYQDKEPMDMTDARTRTMASIYRRRGQPGFRRALLKAYSGRCVITGCDTIDALEAAHILPYKGDHTNTVENGILLRADIHTLFDLGKIGISPEDNTVIVHDELRTGHYGYLHNRPITLPKGKDQPRLDWLEKHRLDHKL